VEFGASPTGLALALPRRLIGLVRFTTYYSGVATTDDFSEARVFGESLKPSVYAHQIFHFAILQNVDRQLLGFLRPAQHSGCRFIFRMLLKLPCRWWRSRNAASLLANPLR
jgi:hypothetical protein